MTLLSLEIRKSPDREKVILVPSAAKHLLTARLAYHSCQQASKFPIHLF